MTQHYQIGITPKQSNKVVMLLIALLFLIALIFASLSSAKALTESHNYTLFGEAEIVSPGSGSEHAAQTVSDDDPGFGGVDFEVPSGATFADIETFASDFNVTDDNCGGGAPRLSIGVDDGGTTKYIHAYFGESPNYNTCAPNTWVNTGDLLESGKTVDTSQLGGTFYDDYDNAVTNYGGLTVTELFVVTDAGWSAIASGGDGEQTVLFDNVLVNDAFYTFEPNVPLTKDDCKNGGWVEFTDPSFRNQGDCVSWVVSDNQSTNNPDANPGR